MPTIAITLSFARVFQHLQLADGRLAMQNWGRNKSSAHWFLCTASCWRNDPEFEISPAIVQDLRKFRLIERTMNSFYWPIRELYQLSDIGKAFRLPPEKFWIAEPAVTE